MVGLLGLTERNWAVPWAALFFLLQMAPQIHLAPIEAGAESEQQPLILGWNDFFGQANVIRTVAPRDQVDKCPRRCRYSHDRAQAPSAAAIVFHANGGSQGLPPGRRPEQLYVFFDLESPQHSPASGWPSSFFNLSMTYRASSATNLMAPYGYLHRVDPNRTEDLRDMWTEGEILERVRRKSKLALQVASNCSPHSGRQLYTVELAKHVQVTGYGRCFGKSCDQQCYQRELEEHFFYLAFENSVCRHYVTEKFWNAFRRLAVPVVLSRQALRGLGVPQDAFIAADDFPSACELGVFLEGLSRDEQRYMSYFNWTRFYRRRSDIDPERRAICRLCEMAHREWAPGSRVVDLQHFWRDQGQCTPNFAHRFIGRSSPNLPAVADRPPFKESAKVQIRRVDDAQVALLEWLSAYFLLHFLASFAILAALACLLFRRRCHLPKNRLLRKVLV